jgi:Tol biopolymer transport system component
MARTRLCFAVLFAISFIDFNSLLTVEARPPQKIAPAILQVDGVLKDATDKPLSGVIGVVFALYAEQQSTNSLWVETQNVIADDSGRFTAFLGVTHPEAVPVNLFASGEAKWLGMQVQGQPEEPRVLLASVADLVLRDTAPTIRAATFSITPTTQRVSVPQGGGEPNGFSTFPAISADGRYVAFESVGTNLVSGDTNSSRDIFLRDRFALTTDRVSVAQGGGQGDSLSFFPAISGDGRYVTFSSLSRNLVSSDTNGVQDIFLRDRTLGTTELLTIPGGSGGSGNSDRPAISSDGRYVAFESYATYLVTGDYSVSDNNNASDVFVRDRVLGKTVVVSTNDGDNRGLGIGSSFAPAISADGRYVAFNSLATNLVPGDTNNLRDVFVRDQVLGTIERVSVATGGTQLNSSSGAYRPAISADGRYVVFDNTSGIFVRDRILGTTEAVSQANGSGSPTISADGRYVAFHSFASTLVSGDTNAASDIFVYDRALGTIELVIGGRGVEGDGNSFFPAFSANGRYMAYQTAATNLLNLAADSNGVDDIYLRDRATTENPRLSVADAQTAEGSSGSPGKLLFTVSLTATSSQNVSFRYWTEDVSARKGSDYNGVVGSATIPAGFLSTTIAVTAIGDSMCSIQPKIMHLNIDVPLKATITDGQGVGTIIDDDPCLRLIGTSDLSPLSATVAAGERVNYRLSWTVPSGSWRQLESIELRIGEDGALLWLRFDESSRTFSVFNPSTGRFGPAFAAGSSNVLKSRGATLYLAESSVSAAGPSSPEVTLLLSLGFEPSVVGSDYPVEVQATNDDGQFSGFERGATLSIVDKHD